MSENTGAENSGSGAGPRTVRGGHTKMAAMNIDEPGLPASPFSGSSGEPSRGRARVKRRGRTGGVRQEQAEATRALLLRVGEQLFAERGLANVSIRQIVEAAGQANNSALAYHIGTRTDLLHEIGRLHGKEINRRTAEMLRATRNSDDPREHVACTVLPYTEYLAGLGHPSWLARFTAQVASSPDFAEHVDADPDVAPLVKEDIEMIYQHAPDVPPEIRMLRLQTLRAALVNTCSEQEGHAARTGVPADWDLVGQALTDSMTGMFLAPVDPKTSARLDHRRRTRST